MEVGSEKEVITLNIRESENQRRQKNLILSLFSVYLIPALLFLLSDTLIISNAKRLTHHKTPHQLFCKKEQISQLTDN